MDAATPQAYIYIDATKFSQVLRNFISNAIKFTSENVNGFVRVYATLVNRDGMTMPVLRIEVEDNGFGIEKVVYETIIIVLIMQVFI